MTQPTRTVEQVVQGQADKTVPQCTFCRNGRDHTVCNGTGQAPKFPMLRGPCPLGPMSRHCDPTDHIHESDPCKGCGWLLVTTIEALLEAGKPYDIRLRWVSAEEEWQADTLMASDWSCAQIPNMALALALEAAEEANDAR